MHSFPLRYVALGLVIYIQNSFADLCPSESIDLRSLASRSSLILEGLADGAVGLPGGLYLVGFKVQRLHKGNLGPRPVRARPGLARTNVSSFVLVGQFRAPDERNSCFPALDTIRIRSSTPYLVFLGAAGTPDAKVAADQFESTNLTQEYLSSIGARDTGGEYVFYYRLSGFPQRATDQTRVAVRAGSGPRKSEGTDAVELISGHQHVAVGETLVMRCKAKGRRRSSVANVFWFRNGSILKNGKKSQHTIQKSHINLKDKEDGIIRCWSLPLFCRERQPRKGIEEDQSKNIFFSHEAL